MLNYLFNCCCGNSIFCNNLFCGNATNYLQLRNTLIIVKYLIKYTRILFILNDINNRVKLLNIEYCLFENYDK